MPPLLSAIVLNYRTPKEAIRCVRALQRQTIADQMEVLIVDNRSEDDSIQLLRNTFGKGHGGRASWQDTSVTFIETPRNLGYGRGNALAIAQARGRFLLLINPDNELEPEGAETMIAAMEADPRIGIIAPQLLHADGSIRDSVRAFPTITDVFIKRTLLRHFFGKRVERYLQHGENPAATRNVGWVAGACFLIRRDLYEEIGGFDPRYFLFFDDTDLCRRVWGAGRRVVYLPAARATDRKHRLSEGGFLSVFTKRTVRIHLASALKYFWKWRGIALRM